MSSKHGLAAQFLEARVFIDTEFTGRFDALTRDVADVRERLGRVEGHLVGPESFAPRPRRQPDRDDPPSDHRAAG